MAYPEPDYIKKCVYFVSGPPGPAGQTRAQRHADPANVGGFSLVPCAPTPEPGIAIGQFRPDGFQSQYACVSAGTYNFVFQLITGLPSGTAGANIPWPNKTAPLQTLSGTSFVTYLGVYLPGGGGSGPSPPPGASIDALDLTTGALLNGLNGNFVTVDDEPGNAPDASLTTSANVYGWVPTSFPRETRGRTGVKITALGQLGLSGPNFCGWLDLLNPPANGVLPSANDISFIAHNNDSYYRLACYADSPLVYGPGPSIWPGVVIIGIDGKVTFIPGLGGPPVVIENGRVAGTSEDKD
jgi:hypothetical protein